MSQNPAEILETATSLTNYQYLMDVLSVRDGGRFDGPVLYFERGNESGKFWRYFRHISPTYNNHSDSRSSICLVCAGVELKKLTENNNGVKDIPKMAGLFTSTVYKTTFNSYAQTHFSSKHKVLLKHHLNQTLTAEEKEKYLLLKDTLCNFYEDFDEATFEPLKRKFKESFSLIPVFKYYIAAWLMLSGRPSTVVEDPWLRTIFQKFAPKVTLPRRVAESQHEGDIFLFVFKEVLEKLHKAKAYFGTDPFLTIQADAWTSKSMKSVLGVLLPISMRINIGL